ncbi:MAG: quinolinate synthase NadA [Dehalococcoidia bacterium]|nr:quinolinate synthase NadA [Dehalococcoidia bacterium]
MVKEALFHPDTAAACENVPATVPLGEERSFAFWQQDIPEEYWPLEADELRERIAAARRALGPRAAVPGHHYQRDDIIRFADVRGDSLKLAQWAARQSEAEFIVFCGVHFMAESADILTAPRQAVMLPNMAAGCSMADMAAPEDVLSCWRELEELGIAGETVPVTYINSAASLKAFCGQRDGIVCTSTNARAVVRWAFQQKKRVFFFPDEHLGRYTGVSAGIPLEAMPVWDYFRPKGSLGGNEAERLRESRMVLWKGYCGVHQRFTVEQVRQARERDPEVRVAVHPECRLDVIQAADFCGSTEQIIRAVEESPSGSRWAVGTEINMVRRLAQENRDKTVFSLDPDPCPCSTMYRIHPAYLCWVLERLVAGEVVNRVTVEPETARWAKLALDRMLSIA